MKPEEKELPFKKRGEGGIKCPKIALTALESKKSSVFSCLPCPGQPGHAHPVRAVLML